MPFITETDYDVLSREEIRAELDLTNEKKVFATAENMAISQMINHLGGRYDVNAIFINAPAEGEDDERDAYIVMLCIDLVLYHVWSKEGGNQIPETRQTRYEDALTWLKSVQKGAYANLPEKKDDNGNPMPDIRIKSKHQPESNRY